MNRSIQSDVELSIILVNWNSSDYIRQCINSINQYTTGVNFEIVVVDNASPADNADVLKREFSQITLVKSLVNLGFAGANNIGVRHSSGKYLLFLNPDTKLIAPAIRELLDALKSWNNVGIVGCKLLNADMSVQTSSVQAFPTILNNVFDAEILRRRWPLHPIWGMEALFSSRSPAKAEAISGACMLIRREVFKEAGQFSEEYFMYAEDLDLCYKVASAGYSNICANDITIIHYGGGSSHPATATVRKWQSNIQYLVKHRGRRYAVTFRCVMSVVAILRLGLLGVARMRSGTRRKSDSFTTFNKWTAILRTLIAYSGNDRAGCRNTEDGNTDSTEISKRTSNKVMRI